MDTLLAMDPARQLAAAEHELVIEFPAVEAGEIHALMEGENGRYATASVRDYLSILVAGAVRRVLRARQI